MQKYEDKNLIPFAKERKIMAYPQIKETLYQDFLAVPANRVAEILNGELVTQPRPAPKHTRAASSLGDELMSPFDKGRGGPGGWVILDEPEIHLGENILVPDLAGWKREKMPTLPQTAFFETPPDWVCEVLSPSTARYDRLEKRDIYATYKVSHLWFIDPDAQTLEAFALHEKGWKLLKTFGHDGMVDADPFGAVPFPLKNLWFDEET